ncbi:hypothetical protein EB796_015372 [Bugula neritina]|uniref:Uncharacterized protein n=1 Tax=Bugula neritina TaxID=10212 RepID=A0A7J7JKH7_BUGNE|nr:hypothetical protein EB796_015372 [Bugula neritina]
MMIINLEVNGDVLPVPRYTPGENETALNVSCRDVEHSFWFGGNTFMTFVIQRRAPLTVQIAYTSPSLPDVYVDETITFRCTSTGFSNLKSLVLRYNETYASHGCERSNDKWVGVSSQVVGVEVSGGFTEQCAAVGDVNGFNITLQVTLSNNLVTGTFDCMGFEKGKIGKVVSPTKFELPVVKGLFVTRQIS